MLRRIKYNMSFFYNIFIHQIQKYLLNYKLINRITNHKFTHMSFWKWHQNATFQHWQCDTDKKGLTGCHSFIFRGKSSPRLLFHFPAYCRVIFDRNSGNRVGSRRVVCLWLAPPKSTRKGRRRYQRRKFNGNSYPFFFCNLKLTPSSRVGVPLFCRIDFQISTMIVRLYFSLICKKIIHVSLYYFMYLYHEIIYAMSIVRNENCEGDVIVL